GRRDGPAPERAGFAEPASLVSSREVARPDRIPTPYGTTNRAARVPPTRPLFHGRIHGTGNPRAGLPTHAGVVCRNRTGCRRVLDRGERETIGFPVRRPRSPPRGNSTRSWRFARQ